MKFILFILSLLGFYKTEVTPTPVPTVIPPKYVFPVDNFEQRITKKNFGIFVTPQNSPIKLEKFYGYHTGVDTEFGDIDSDISVYSITAGQVIYSGYVSGYGGFIAIQYPEFIGIYGHLRPSSLIKNKAKVIQDQQIGVLGTAYSPETNGERRHLHFAILKGNKLNFRGYVQNKSELTSWIDPQTLLR